MRRIPRPGMTPLVSVSGRASMSCWMAPLATMTRPRRERLSIAPARPMEIMNRGLETSQAYWAAIAAATLPTPATMTTRPPPSHDEIRGPTLSERGILRTRACASCSSAAMIATGRASGMRHRGLWLGDMAQGAVDEQHLEPVHVVDPLPAHLIGDCEGPPHAEAWGGGLRGRRG